MLLIPTIKLSAFIEALLHLILKFYQSVETALLANVIRLIDKSRLARYMK